MRLGNCYFSIDLRLDTTTAGVSIARSTIVRLQPVLATPTGLLLPRSHALCQLVFYTPSYFRLFVNLFYWTGALGLCNAEHWLHWTRHFGPISGLEALGVRFGRKQILSAPQINELHLRWTQRIVVVGFRASTQPMVLGTGQKVVVVLNRHRQTYPLGSERP